MLSETICNTMALSCTSIDVTLLQIQGDSVVSDMKVYLDTTFSGCQCQHEGKTL